MTLKLNEDGTLTLLDSHDMGNGVVTMQTMMVAEVLNNTDKVDTLKRTDACTFNLGDYASRGVFVEGGELKDREIEKSYIRRSRKIT